MWVFLGDVIEENLFHNCVDESEKALLVSTKGITADQETGLNNTVNKTHIFKIERFYSRLLRYN